MSIDYQFQHNSHVVDFRMRQWMDSLPKFPLSAYLRTAEEMEFERNWLNFHNQLYYGTIKR